MIGIFGYLVLTAHAFGMLDDVSFTFKRIEENLLLRYLEPLIPLCIVLGLAETRSFATNRLRITFVQLILVVIAGLLVADTLRNRATLNGEPDPVDFFRFMANEYWLAHFFDTPSVLWWTVFAVFGVSSF